MEQLEHMSFGEWARKMDRRLEKTESGKEISRARKISKYLIYTVIFGKFVFVPTDCAIRQEGEREMVKGNKEIIEVQEEVRGGLRGKMEEKMNLLENPEENG